MQSYKPFYFMYTYIQHLLLNWIFRRNFIFSLNCKRNVHSKSFQSCLTLCNPVVCSPSGFSVHGILQTRILEWVAMTSSRESLWPRDWTCIFCDSCIAGRFFKVDSLLLSHWGSPLVTAMKVKVSPFQLFATPWIIQTMEFFRPEYWRG